MRKLNYFIGIAALLAFPAYGLAAQATTAQANAQTDSSSSAKPAQQDSLAAASRKAKEQKAKSSTKPAKVYTNENLPTSGTISTVGTTSDATGGEGAAGASKEGSSKSGGSASGAGQDAAAWRARFQGLRSKLSQDQAELDVMQREAGNLNLQNYSDPVKGMQQGLSREDINKKNADIEAKKQQIAADQQAISDAEDELRKAGGDPGWSR